MLRVLALLVALSQFASCPTSGCCCCNDVDSRERTCGQAPRKTGRCPMPDEVRVCVNTDSCGQECGNSACGSDELGGDTSGSGWHLALPAEAAERLRRGLPASFNLAGVDIESVEWCDVPALAEHRDWLRSVGHRPYRLSFGGLVTYATVRLAGWDGDEAIIGAWGPAFSGPSAEAAAARAGWQRLVE